MNHREIRRTFLEFYAKRGHKIVPSSPLVPKDDPSLLFTGAGMVQFKPYWAGTVELPYRRATSIQKCLRASDLEEVGRTPRHHTFFEMMGNFSFGDYFKAEGIRWAWEYLTEVVGLDPERLFPTVLGEDDEAYEVWTKGVGLPESKVHRLGVEDNFWGPIGGGGACGPDSEIFYDLGEEMGCGKPTCAPGCDCNRFAEVYNVVFPQYNQLPDGTREPLKNRGIDTGVGLERVAMASQGRKTNFETDLFAPIVAEVGMVLDTELTDENRQMAWIAADAARALTFAITDGVIPSNEARGYVLRGILRRALLFAHRQGVGEPFLYRVAGKVVEHMKQWYPELATKREQAAMMVKSEEERFLRTLDAGLERWQDVLERHRSDGVVPGEELFKLHDTFGFHIELVKELAREAGVRLDNEGFEQAMQAQRERSQKKTLIDHGISVAGELELFGDARFVGYERDECETELLHFSEVKDKEVEGRVFEVHLKDSPFYAEAGGQTGDTGSIEGAGFELEVLDTYNKQGVAVSKARLKKGEVEKGEVTARVDRERRREIERAHTATHLLHAALREVLGDYVKQEGSLVEPGRLRFDFAAFEPMTREQVLRVEELVYAQVLRDVKLDRRQDVPFEEAKKMGALAFFGEQYGDKVTVVSVPGFSMELCGGTHLRSTGEIGLFRIVSETGVAAGIRRIEALVGRAAFDEAASERAVITELMDRFGGTGDALVQKVTGLAEQAKGFEQRVRTLSTQLARTAGDELAGSYEPFGEIRGVVGHLPQFDVDELRMVADRVRDKLQHDYAGMLTGAGKAGRLSYVVFVSPDLKEHLPAGKLAKRVGKALGGGGGGRPDIASGGGALDRLEPGQQEFRAALEELA